jgi:HEAT repeat protein
LIAKLNTRDTWLRKKWGVVLPKLPPILKNQFSPVGDASTIRFEAAECLVKFGPLAKSAVPYLVKQLDATNQESWEAARTLGAIGLDASAALPALKRNIAKRDRLSEIEMARAIWKIDRETNFVTRICTERIAGFPHNEDSDPIVLLGEMGSAAQSTVPVLIKLLTDKTCLSLIRGNAAVALGQMGFKNDAVMSALVAGSTDSDATVRGCSSLALWQLDSRQYARIVAPTVVKLAADWSWDTLLHFAAANHLDIEPALPALRGLAKSDSPPVRKLAEDALKEIDSSVIKEVSNK